MEDNHRILPIKKQKEKKERTILWPKSNGNNIDNQIFTYLKFANLRYQSFIIALKFPNQYLQNPINNYTNWRYYLYKKRIQQLKKTIIVNIRSNVLIFNDSLTDVNNIQLTLDKFTEQSDPPWSITKSLHDWNAFLRLSSDKGIHTKRLR